MNNTYNTVVEKIYEAKYVMKEKSRNRKDKIDELADNIDDIIDEMNNTIIENSLLLPSESVNSFEVLSDLFDEINTNTIFQQPEKIDVVIEALGHKFWEVFDLMRNDPWIT